MKKATPILITGVHRSGTTWVGKMISLSKKVTYFQEPFNKYHDPGVFGANINRNYLYITQENEARIASHLRRTLGMKYDYFKGLKFMLTAGKYRGTARNIKELLVGRMMSKTPLFKDPIALCASEWLHTNFNFKPIVLIRHPAALIGSIKRVNYRFWFEDLASQKELMAIGNSNFTKRIEDFSAMQKKTGDLDTIDIIDQGILLWCFLYEFVDKLRGKFPDWLYLKHEDLSLDPANYYERIFNYIGIDWEEGIRSKILDYSSDKNPTSAEKGIVHQLKRNSKKNIHGWKRILSPTEIEKIYSETKPVWKKYYSDSDW